METDGDDLEYEPDSEDEGEMEQSDINFPQKIHFTIPFPKIGWAEVVRNSLAVDQELKPTIVRRKLAVADGALHVTYEAMDAKMLRTVVSSFFDMLLLVVETIKVFGEEQLPA